MTEQQQPQPRIKQEPESAATFVATVRAEHDAMTQWYNNEDDTTTTGMAVAMLDGLHAKFGPVYPKVWKDVLNWSGWHETRQAYLLHSSSTGGITTTAVVEEQQQQVKMEDEQQQQQQHNTNNNNISHKKDDDAPPAVKKQRKSRWGTAAPATTSPSTTTTSNSPSVASTTTTTTNDTNAAMILEWQAELRRLNQRLESIPTEAARVDALPRNHRERSPSPPPGT